MTDKLTRQAKKLLKRLDPHKMQCHRCGRYKLKSTLTKHSSNQYFCITCMKNIGYR